MYKLIIAVTLLAISAVSVAESPAPSKENGYTSTRNLPVIVGNTVIAQGTCRLSFENGTTRDVPCKTKTNS